MCYANVIGFLVLSQTGYGCQRIGQEKSPYTKHCFQIEEDEICHAARRIVVMHPAVNVRGHGSHHGGNFFFELHEVGAVAEGQLHAAFQLDELGLARALRVPSAPLDELEHESDDLHAACAEQRAANDVGDTRLGQHAVGEAARVVVHRLLVDTERVLQILKKHNKYNKGKQKFLV